MPTDTFMKLPQEKKDKIIVAAKKEFARAPIAEVSIKNIVNDAEIARGSFYQYFESKQDLLIYIIKHQASNIKEEMEKALKRNKGDIFETFIVLYDHMANRCVDEQDGQLYRKIFENIKVGEENLFVPEFPEQKEAEFVDVYDLVDLTKLKLHKPEDMVLIIKMLHAITRTALACNIKRENKEKAREDFIQQLQYLKYGVSNRDVD